MSRTYRRVTALGTSCGYSDQALLATLLDQLLSLDLGQRLQFDPRSVDCTPCGAPFMTVSRCKALAELRMHSDDRSSDLPDAMS